MVESQLVQFRASDHEISVLERFKPTVARFLGVENPSLGTVSKYLVNAIDDHTTNPAPGTPTILEHLLDKDPNKKTLIELGSGAIKTKLKK